MSQVYKTTTKIRFQQADPAQILFFGNLLGLCHDLYEDLLASMGLQWKEYFQNPDFLIPIRQTNCEFFKPLFAGEQFEVEISFTKIGESSFEVSYRFLQSGFCHAQAKIAHVFVNSQTKTKTKIPDWFRSKIIKYHLPESLG